MRPPAIREQRIWLMAALASALIYVDNIRDAFAHHDRTNAVPSIYTANAEPCKANIAAVITAYFSFCPMRDRPPRPDATLS